MKLEKTDEPFPPLAGDLESIQKRFGYSADAAIAYWYKCQVGCELWENDHWRVVKKQVGLEYFHLHIRRKDGDVPVNQYQAFQHIKNAVLGEDWEAVQLYPSKDREFDESNTYHLWSMPRWHVGITKDRNYVYVT